MEHLKSAELVVHDAQGVDGEGNLLFVFFLIESYKIWKVL